MVLVRDAPRDLDRRDQLRPGERAGEAVQRRRRKTVRFHQLYGKTGVRVQQKRVDPQTGEEVAYEEIVKGYEIAPDRYVMVEPAELEALEPKKTKTIEIEEFVDLDGDRPDLLRPPLLPRARHRRRKALQAAARGDGETGKVAIARVVIRSKEQLVAIRPMGDVLRHGDDAVRRRGGRRPSARRAPGRRR